RRGGGAGQGGAGHRGGGERGAPGRGPGGGFAPPRPGPRRETGPATLTPAPRFCYVDGIPNRPRLGEGPRVPRTIFAFNGDLESCLALHWLVHERGHEVVALSINLGQEVYLEPLGELALDLGATSSLVLDRRAEFLRAFALPVLQAGAVYQGGCFL